MKYESDVPETEQINMRDFKILPGHLVKILHEESIYAGWVVEIWFANPEYILNGPDAENAGIVMFGMNEQHECKNFLNNHINAKIKLKKSMWATIEFLKPPPQGSSLCSIQTVKLYAYDIEKMIKNGTLEIVGILPKDVPRF